jgi:hypothetical protein
LDAAYALWIEENVRISPLKDFSSLREIVTPSDARVERPIPKTEVKQQNEQAMAALQGILSGVKGRPRKS